MAQNNFPRACNGFFLRSIPSFSISKPILVHYCFFSLIHCLMKIPFLSICWMFQSLFSLNSLTNFSPLAEVNVQPFNYNICHNSTWILDLFVTKHRIWVKFRPFSFWLFRFQLSYQLSYQLWFRKNIMTLPHIFSILVEK